METGEKHIYSVSSLNRDVRGLLEGSFPSIWVEGEISNFVRPSSGHFYFTLKDAGAQIRGAMFRNSQRGLDFTPKNGDQVLLRAKLSLYEGRGDYQLIVSAMEQAGSGALRKAFEALKKRLQQEGLFDPQHKKPLPKFAKQIGVITSATGAAVRDILTTLRRRFPLTPVIIYPTLVQGSAAIAPICNAIKKANERQECDVLILARGGGSLEDLWCFNEEVVARSIFASQIPIVSGIGHEIDFTIADFVADHRAATPTAAAELVSLEQLEILQILSQRQLQVLSLIENKLHQLSQRIDNLEKRLKSPQQQLRESRHRLELLNRALYQGLQRHLKQLLNQVMHYQQRLHQHSPQKRLQTYIHKTNLYKNQLINLIQQFLQQKQSQLKQQVVALDAISPLATLKRGYAIVTTDSGKIVTQSTDCHVGDKVTTRLAKGSILCEVIDVNQEANHEK